MTDYANVGRLLDALTGHGVYDLDLVRDQLPKYGFTYDEATDQLSYGQGSVRLGAGTRAEIARSMAEEATGNLLDPGPDETKMIDALKLSEAIFRLLIPNTRTRSELYNGRNKGFRKNVEAIIAFYESNPKLTD